MQKLNLKATKIFCRLLFKLKEDVYIKIKVEGYLPLTLECIGRNISTPLGVATGYSLSHSYIMNGDLMRDPEMCFFVIDNRTEAKEFELIGIYPLMYQLDSLGIYEESISIEHGEFNVKDKWQRSHCNFANQWLSNIKEQEFLVSKVALRR